MKNRKSNLMVVLLLILFVGLAWIANRHVNDLQHPDYTSFSNGNYGVSLLYDTLRHMQYPVGILYRPVGETVSVNNAVFIIQPTNPRLNTENIESILNWVRRGGRLIYLENRQPNVIDRALDNRYQTTFGSMRVYRLGMGEIMTGRADTIVNINLMEDPVYGKGIAYILTGWNPELIYFAEYYHGYREVTGAFRQLPLWLQLVVIQMIIATAALIWHYGKRFGVPIPFYEEIEREENEQILVLARLYKQAKK